MIGVLRFTDGFNIAVLLLEWCVLSLYALPLRHGSSTVVGQSSSLELVCGAWNMSSPVEGRGRMSDEHFWCSVGQEGELKLIIENARDSDAGNYTCEQFDGTILADVSVTVSKQRARTSYTNATHTRDDLHACEDRRGLMRVWKKDGEAVCAQKPGDEVCALEIITGIALEKTSKWRMKRLVPPILAALMGLLVVVLLILGNMYIRRRNKEYENLRTLHDELLAKTKNTKEMINPERPLHDQIDELPYDRNYEIHLHRLSIKKVISHGEYGRMYAGELRGKGLSKQIMEVAVKGPKRAAKYNDIRALADEMRLMIAVGVHPNVLCLIGTVTENMKRGGDLYGIVEPTMCDLKTFLSKRKAQYVDELAQKPAIRSNRSSLLSLHRKLSKVSMRIKYEPQGNVSTSLLTSFSYQIASGMEFLASKMCVHRDLAARNVLVRKDRLLRIADFGEDRQWDYQYLIKSIQYASPFKAMARESISNSRFTEKSDVWSYGVLLWEVFTLGDDPFKEFETAAKLTSFYEGGGRLTQPQFMPENMSVIMSQCWKEDPGDRPTFLTLKKMTEGVLRERNPQLLLSVHNKLMEELLAMRKYAEWRNGPRVERTESADS